MSGQRHATFQRELYASCPKAVNQSIAVAGCGAWGISWCLSDHGVVNERWLDKPRFVGIGILARRDPYELRRPWCHVGSFK